MACLTIEELDLYANERLQGDDLGRARRHISRCRACRDRLCDVENQQQLLPLIGGLGAELERPEPPVDLAVPGYRIVREIHRGGQGVVYEAIQEGTGQRVALKIISHRSSDKRWRERFERELELVRKLRHPNIVRLLDGGKIGERPYLVMEYIDGDHLGAFDVDGRRPTHREILGLVLEIAEAVHYAHQRGVIHRDLKPANILVSEDGRPHVLDFGIARPITGRLEVPAAALTGSGMFSGTLPYAAPEQITGAAAEVDVRTDVYALGVLLYELLTGSHPYLEVTALADLVAAITRGSAPRASQRVKGLDGDVDAVVAKAMARDPADRYQSTESLARDIRRYLDGEPVEAREPGGWYLLTKMLRRHRRVAAAVIAVFLLLLAATAVCLAFWIETREQRDAARLAQQEAARGRDAASVLLGERDRLADILVVRKLLDEAERLYPIGPELVEPCQRWLARADELLGRIDTHASVLSRLRQRAKEADGAGVGARQHELETLTGKVETYRRQLEAGQGSLRELEALETRLAELNDAIAQERVWRYSRPEDAWYDEKLTFLTKRLHELQVQKRRVEERLERSRNHVRRSIKLPAVAWSDCLATIAESPIYRGLELTPQIGLTPLYQNIHSGLWEFWVIESGDRPGWDGVAANWQMAAGTGIVMVLLPGGTFDMGSVPPGDDVSGPNVDPESGPLDGPVQAVELEPFFISKYETTLGQWVHLNYKEPEPSGSGRIVRASDRFRHPAHGVTWEECDRTARRLGLELPTEAQWEYACRGGTKGVWFCAGDVLDRHANFADGSDSHYGLGERRFIAGYDDGFDSLAPVGSFYPNPFGLHDMLGNLAELCRDGHGSYGTGRRRAGDGLLVRPEPAFKKSIRGGSFANPARLWGSAAREGMSPTDRDDFVGCRLVRRVK